MAFLVPNVLGLLKTTVFSYGYPILNPVWLYDCRINALGETPRVSLNTRQKY